MEESKIFLDASDDNVIVICFSIGLSVISFLLSQVGDLPKKNKIQYLSAGDGEYFTPQFALLLQNITSSSIALRITPQW